MALSELKSLQFKFHRSITELKMTVFAAGYFVVTKECLRTPVQAWVNALPSGSMLQAMCGPIRKVYPDPVGGVGTSTSLHQDGLAEDMYIFNADGTEAPREVYQKFGDFWKGKDPLFAWGGDFKSNDIYHFSCSYQGRR